MALSDPDSPSLNGATLVLAPPVSRELDRLAVDTGDTPIRAVYNAGTGTLRLSNTAAIDDYAQVLRTATYENLSESPDTADRLVTFTVSDGAAESVPVHTTVAIQAVNDAPVLDNSGNLRFASINEDDTTQNGNAVATLLASGGGTPISDVDQGDPQGIAVIEVGTSNGDWQYSLDAGATWRALAGVADTAAVLLNPEARLRFLPRPNFNGQAALTFRAWDQSSGANGDTAVDTSINGGAAPFSSATETAVITVLPVDDPPLVDANGRLPGTGTAAAFLASQLPAPLTAADAAVADLDSATIFSLTASLLNRPDGPAEAIVAALPFSTAITGVYDPQTGRLQLSGSAPLADYTAALRSLAYTNTAVPPDPAPRQFELSASDGSSDSALTRITLQPVLQNTPPTLDESAVLSFTPVGEDDLDPPGDSVAALLASAATDPISDSDPQARRGLAVIAAQNDNGTWQFSVDSGQTWLAFGPLSAQSATLLDESARLRFLPDPDFAGPPRTVTVRAWDQTSGASGYSGIDSGGGAFSSATVTVSVDVQPRNDAPVLKLPPGVTALYAEDGAPVVITGPVLDLSDQDDTALTSATVRILDKKPSEPDILAAPGDISPIRASYNAAAGVLSLNGSAPLALYQAVLRSVTFANTAQDPDTADRQVQYRAFDGQNAGNAVTAAVQVAAQNDPPLLDLNGIDDVGHDAVVYYDEDENGIGTAVPLAPGLELEDVDNTALVSATVQLAPRPDGAAERLAAQTAGTNITAVYDVANGRLTLTGLESLANYRKVLRSTTYTNSKPFINRALRQVSFSANDGTAVSAPRITTIIPRPQFAFFPLAQFAGDMARPDEPNNTCAEAFPISPDRRHSFQADDRNDWYRFTLPAAGDVSVELENFRPLAGQLLAASGPCGALQRLGQNGDYATTKTIELGRLNAGTYTVLVINDGRTDIPDPYDLFVRYKPSP